MENLYHYTDSNGLLGILKGNSIWLTNIQFLNDYSEFENGKRIIYDQIDQRISSINSNPIPTPKDCAWTEINQDAIIRYLQHIKEALSTSNHPGFDPKNYLFVFSLSKERNLLSQWRGYCPNGGFSLALNKNKLNKCINRYKQNISLENCIYYMKHKIDAANQAIEDAIQTFLELVCTQGSHDEMASINFNVYHDQFRKLQLLAAKFKHEGFHEENEIRLISNGYTKDILRHRVSNNIVIPYLNVPIESEVINEVMVGPGNNATKARTSLLLLLWQLELFKNIKISESETPLL